jgi:hypothetical protein
MTDLLDQLRAYGEQIEADLAAGFEREVSLVPAATRPRPRHPWWPIVAAAAVLVAVLSLAVIVRNEADPQPHSSVPTVAPTVPMPADPIPLLGSGAPMIAPGTHFFDADGDAATSLGANVTIEGTGWRAASGDFQVQGSEPTLAAGFYREPAQQSASGWGVSLMIVQVDTVPQAGCRSDVWEPAGRSAKDLAEQFAANPDVIVREPLASVTAFGYQGYHLLVELPEYSSADGYQCAGERPSIYDGWQANGFGRTYSRPGQTLEYWILDVDGRPLLIEASWYPDTPAADVADLRTAIESLAIIPPQ